MSIPASPQHPKPSNSIPTNATFIWRNGNWLLQRDGQSRLKKLPRAFQAALNTLQMAGQLTEVSPGLFRLSGTAPGPLINDSESPLGRLAHLKQPDGTPFLDAEQLRAGEKLRLDYERAHLSTRMTMIYEASLPKQQLHENQMENMTDNTLAARQALHGAMQAVGAELAGMLYQVCCLANGLEQAEMHLNLTRRAGKVVLQLALARLARHYGFKARLAHAGPGKIGQWAIEGFKPAIQPPRPHQP